MTSRGIPTYLLLILTIALSACDAGNDPAPTTPNNLTPSPTTSPSSDTQTSTETDPAEITTCDNPRPQLCTQDYNPVCAMVDTGVRCVRAPCPEASEWKTYSNACMACSDETAIGYKVGECP